MFRGPDCQKLEFLNKGYSNFLSKLGPSPHRQLNPCLPHVCLYTNLFFCHNLSSRQNLGVVYRYIINGWQNMIRQCSPKSETVRIYRTKACHMIKIYLKILDTLPVGRNFYQTCYAGRCHFIRLEYKYFFR